MGRRPLSVALAFALLLVACGAVETRDAGADAGASPEHACLVMLAGRWESTARAVFDSGEALDVSSTVDADWDLGGRYVVARSVHRFADPDTGERQAESEAVSWFGWDAAQGSYRYWTFFSDGGAASGRMSYDAPTSTWTLEEFAHDPASGRLQLVGRGEMQYLDDGEKIVRWHQFPADGDGFRSEGRSRRIHDP